MDKQVGVCKETDKTGYSDTCLDFPGGTVDKNPCANAGDMGLIPGPGRFHEPWSN